jgi:hypothetical protein
MAGPVGPEDHVSGIIRLPGEVTAGIVTLFGLAAVVFLGDVLRRGLSRRRPGDDEGGAGEERSRMPTWLRTISQIASFLYFAVLGYALWSGGRPLLGLLGGQDGGASSLGPALPRELRESAPPLIAWGFAALALATGLAALAAAVAFALSDRVGRGGHLAESAPAPETVEAAVDQSVDDLRAEPDPRRAIVRCYARFERAAADSGVARRPWLTPMEFTTEALGRLPLPRAAIPTLTALFELARFSHHPLGPRERDRALDALDQIRASLAAGGDRAKAD